jgi:hypothetical protein
VLAREESAPRAELRVDQLPELAAAHATRMPRDGDHPCRGEGRGGASGGLRVGSGCAQGGELSVDRDTING